jgi:gas vesicle protein
MRFILGMITGVVVGAATATYAASQQGQDLRGEFDRIRADFQQRDFDALGGHLEERFKELQTNLEERFAQTEEGVEEAVEAAEQAEEAAEEAEEAAEEAEEAVPA